jgi:enoyl-CoA hydratase
VIEAETIDGIRVLRLAHGKASALDLELVVALRDAVEAAVTDGASAIVLTGTGHIFCAGVDLFRIVDGGTEYVRRYLAAFDALMFTLFAAPVPMVSAANGHAIAGGAVLVAACDHRLVVEGSGRFGYTELLVGVPLPPTSLEMVRFATPHGLEAMLYTGATFPFEDGLRRGLVDAVVPADALMERALVVARQLAAIPRDTFVLTKRQLREAALQRMRESAQALGPAVAEVWCDERTHAGIRAYLARTVRRG